MLDAPTKLRILNVLVRTTSPFTVAEIISWTGLTRSQIDPQIGRLKNAGVIVDEDTSSTRDPSKKLQRGRPIRHYRLTDNDGTRGQLYRELAEVRKAAGVSDSLSPDLVRGMEILGKLEAVLKFAEATGTTLSEAEYGQQTEQLQEIQAALKLAALAVEFGNDSPELEKLVEAWSRKQTCAESIEKLRRPRGGGLVFVDCDQRVINVSSGVLNTTPKDLQSTVWIAGYHGSGKTRLAILTEYLRKTGAVKTDRDQDVWRPFYDRARSCRDLEEKKIVLSFLDEAQAECRTLHSIKSPLDKFQCRNYAIAKTTARYLPDPELPLTFGVEARSHLNSIPEVLFNEAVFRVRAQRSFGEVYHYWKRATERLEGPEHPIRLELAALIDLASLNLDAWGRLETEAAHRGLLSLVARHELEFIRRPCELMRPRLENTVSGPIGFSHHTKYSFCVYGAYKDILVQHAGIDYLQLARGLFAVGAPCRVAWDTAKAVDVHRGLVLLGNASALPLDDRGRAKVDSFGKILQAEFDAEVVSLVNP